MKLQEIYSPSFYQKEKPNPRGDESKWYHQKDQQAQENPVNREQFSYGKKYWVKGKSKDGKPGKWGPFKSQAEASQFRTSRTDIRGGSVVFEEVQLDEGGKFDPKNYQELVSDVGFFLTLNTAKLQNYAKDEASKVELQKMQEVFRKPVINGKIYTELLNDTKFLNNNKVIPHVLTWIYNFIKYTKPRIEKFTNEKGLQLFTSRLNTITDLYTKLVREMQ